MPTINRLPRKDKTTHHNNTDMRELRQTAYNTPQWKKLRLSYVKQHPLCEECEKKGIVKAADSVHHIKSPFKGGRINYDLLLDPENLESICRECHAEIHNKEKGYVTPEEVIRQLDALLLNNEEDNEEK